MSIIPAQCRTALRDTLRIVHGKNQFTQESNNVRTADKRAQFYINWCTNKSLLPNLTASTNGTPITDIEAVNNIMACFLVDLLQGNNLDKRQIKYKTAERYMMVAARIRTRGTPRLHDPRLDECGKEFHEITRIKQEQRRWESKTDKQNPVTKAMIEYMVTTTDISSPDSIESALADWHIIGEYTGIRISEWAQPDRNPTYTKRQLSPEGDTLAFQFDDVQYFGKHDVRLPQSRSDTLYFTDITRVQYRWRFQKNGIKGETKSLSRNETDPLHCPVRASLRIRERFLRTPNLPKDHPLALFRPTPSTTPVLIKAHHVSQHLQKTASCIYKITDKKELKLYSPHSIRVGACVTLHIAGATDKDIKFLLRWRSDSFMEYLRDIPETCHIMIKHVNNVKNCIQ